MARTLLTPVQVVSTGTNPGAGTAGIADGHKFENDGSQILEVENAAGATRTVTIQTPATAGGQAIAENTISVPASTRRLIGNLDRTVYNQKSGADEGRVFVDYEAGQHASFTVRVYNT